MNIEWWPKSLKISWNYCSINFLLLGILNIHFSYFPQYFNYSSIPFYQNLIPFHFSIKLTTLILKLYAENEFNELHVSILKETISIKANIRLKNLLKKDFI